MKHLYPFLLFFLVFVQSEAQQIILPTDSVVANPFLRTTRVVATEDLVVLQEWQENGQSLLKLTVRKNADAPPQQNVGFQQSSNQTFSVPGVLTGNKGMAVTAVDLNGDGRDEVCYVIETGAGMAELHCLSFEIDPFVHYSMPLTSGLSYWSVNGGTSNNTHNGKIELRAVDVDGDGVEEIAVGYLADEALRIEFLKFNETSLQFSSMGVYADADVSSIAYIVSTGEFWSFCFDDFDYSGTPELVVCGTGNSTGGDSFVKVIAIQGEDALSFELKSEWSLANSYLDFFKIATGDLNGDFIPEIVTGRYSDGGGRVDIFGVGKPTQNGVDYLSGMKRYTDTINIVGGNNGFTTNPTNPIKTFDLVVSDYNNDRFKDIILCDLIYISVVYGRQNFFTMQETFVPFANATFTVANNPPIPHPVSSSFLHSADLNNDGQSQVILVYNSYTSPTDLSWQDLRFWYWGGNDPSTYTLQSNQVIRQVPYNGTANPMNGWKHASCMADISGDAYQLGKPMRYTLTDVVQPLIQLTPPPIHSDYTANGEFVSAFDCPLYDCGFTSSYELSTDSTLNTTVERKTNYSMDASLGVEAGFAGVEVGAKVTTTYGEDFSNLTSTSESFTSGFNITTQFDDMVYCSILKYNVLRYPVMQGDDTLSFITSAQPIAVGASYQWLSSKSEALHNFLPTHEPGNLMSFRPISVLQELYPPNEAKQGTALAITANSAGGQFFGYSSLGSTQLQSESNLNIGAAVSASVYGVSASIEGNVGVGEINTQSVQITSGFKFEMSYPAAQYGPVVVPYSLVPAMKKDSNGAMSINYLTEPTLPSPPANNYWTLNYSNPDPALNLPWLYEFERFGISTINRQRTKSMWMTNTKGGRIFNPNPGDTVIIHTRVFNYGLEPIEQVRLSFSIGHPDQAHVPVVSTSGSAFATNALDIPSQMFEEVTFKVIMPDAEGLDCRLYVQLDPNDQLTNEVHEFNNIGYIDLGMNYTACAPIEVSVPEVKRKNQLIFYPNPSNGIFFLKGDVNEKLQVEVFSITGALLYADSLQNNQLDLSHLPPGIYCVNVKGKNIQESHRLMKN